MVSPSAPQHEAFLLRALDELAMFLLLPGEQRRLVAEAATKLHEQVLYVVTLGDFKRGKSTLINALLDAPVLPRGGIPATAVSTLIRRGEHPRVLARDREGEEELTVADLPGLVTEKGNPGNRQGLEEIVVEYPAPILADGPVLVDTPGMGSRYAPNTAVTRSFLPRVDAALVVLTADSRLSEAEGRLLTEVAEIAPEIAVCLNKVDQLDPEQVPEAEDFVRAGVADLLGDRHMPVYATASRLHFDAPAAGDGLGAVRQWIADHVLGERSIILRERSLCTARSAYEVAQSAFSLERAALLQPGMAATERRAAFEAERAALSLEARSAIGHLLDEVRRISWRVIDPAAGEADVPGRATRKHCRSPG